MFFIYLIKHNYFLMNYIEIETQTQLANIINTQSLITNYAFQNLNFEVFGTIISTKKFENCIFLGCQFPDELICLIHTKNYIFPELKMPFNSYINRLYTKEDLYHGYELGKPESYVATLDKKIYDHFIAYGKEATDIKETLARRLHDHSITDALHDFLATYPVDKKVAIMGGHSLLRSDSGFTTVAKISKTLTEKGYLLLSGGGPGAMEATHVGAWFAGKPENELMDAIRILAEAPSYKDKLWLDKSFEVLHKYPDTNFESVGIPTWLYGHEPPTPFATKIAKYFANSVREDGLLAVAKGGIIFTPGSAGTIQEIFQDATQNHYMSFDVASPMVFFNSEYWTEKYPIYPLFKKLIEEDKYANLILSLCDTENEVINEIEAFTIK